MQINQILDREQIAKEICDILASFDQKCKDITFKKGIYIYGSPGCGKSFFIKKILQELNYDVIQYDAGDVRNKSLIETITSNNMASQNVLQLMSKKVKKIAIIMDEIDGMNNGDKGGITSLIKLIRQKKTKKQRLEPMTMNPIICIGNYYVDKKIKELMKVCNVFELKSPTENQVENLLRQTIFTQVPSATTATRSEPPVPCATTATGSEPPVPYPIGSEPPVPYPIGSEPPVPYPIGSEPPVPYPIGSEPPVPYSLIKYVQGDLRKYDFLIKIHKKNPEILLDTEIMENVFHTKHYSENSKKITQKLLQEPVALDDHLRVMNETDRTIVALLWHENIVDVISQSPHSKSMPFYFLILENMCFADFIDRITFQNQIWQFNEMSSLIKTFYNNKLYHDCFHESDKNPNLENPNHNIVPVTISDQKNPNHNVVVSDQQNPNHNAVVSDQKNPNNNIVPILVSDQKNPNNNIVPILVSDQKNPNNYSASDQKNPNNYSASDQKNPNNYSASDQKNPNYEVRFTKVLTKYSTEYNNILFIYNLCQKIDMDKKDLIAFFQELRLYSDSNYSASTSKSSKPSNQTNQSKSNQTNDQLAFIEKLFENTEIDKLNIRRMYRYLDKNVKRDSASLEEEDDDLDME
jgi:hypothetical protein